MALWTLFWLFIAGLGWLFAWPTAVIVVALALAGVVIITVDWNDL